MDKVIIIATEGLTTNLLYETLSKSVDVDRVFIEPHESKRAIIKRRLKKPGVRKTIGQVCFLLLVLPFISRRKKRIEAILERNDLKGESIPQKRIQLINSVHDKQLIDLVKKAKPTAIFINGTRILKQDFLAQINCPIVNIHVGITPKYRGVHGGYWAIHNGDSALFGVTLHYVDRGIDTGRLIAQMVIPVAEEDNFKTYPMLQYAAGLR